MEINMDQDKIRQKKLYFIVEKLKEFHSKVDVDIQSRIPLEDLVQTANVLITDENIFEVLEKLKEYQNLSEEIYKKERDEEILKNQKEIEEYVRTLDETELAHTLALVRQQHQKKLNELDKTIIRKLDEVKSEQQATLNSLNLPGFFETNDSKVIVIQMNLLSFILRLQKLLAAQNFC